MRNFQNKTLKEQIDELSDEESRQVETTVSDDEDAKTLTCIVCETDLGKPGGYCQTGICGPCCTGEAETLEEKYHTW